MVRTVYAGATIQIIDISDELPVHESKRYWKRKFPPRMVVVHHNAGSVAHRGRKGAEKAGAFFVATDNPEKEGMQGRDWPGFAYHFWAPHAFEVYRGRLVVYQTQKIDVVSYHTPGKNGIAISVCFQGSFAGPFNPASELHPSPDQWRAKDELWGYLRHELGLRYSDLYTHSMFNKPACPGWMLENWVRSVRRQEMQEFDRDHKSKVDWREVQQALARLGFNQQWNVDGIPGLQTRIAVERFQRAEGLVVDGVYGPITEARLVEKMEAYAR
jgi:hypothetical protein